MKPTKPEKHEVDPFEGYCDYWFPDWRTNEENAQKAIEMYSISINPTLVRNSTIDECRAYYESEAYIQHLIDTGKIGVNYDKTK